MLPDFVIIGAMKCATTSIHQALAKHPDICMSKLKETDFFIDEKNWNKGLEWYKNQFNGECKFFGEASPNYTMYPSFQGIPERMHSVIPNAKLIYIVRDPIDRIRSHYEHQWYAGRKSSSLEEVLKTDERNHYINTSRYFLQIEQYLHYYRQEQIMIISFEEYKDNPSSILKQICEFIGASCQGINPELITESHKTEEKYRLPPGFLWLQKGGGLIRYLRFFARTILPTDKIAKLIKKLSKIPDITVSEKTKLSLKNDLFKDAEKIRAISGKKFNTWTV